MRSFLTESVEVTDDVHGEAVNVILACAIAALFLVKNKGVLVGRSHIATMLGYVKRQPETAFTSMESASDTYDQIMMRIPVSEVARAYLFDERTEKSPDFDMIDSVIDFVNNHKEFNSLAGVITNNGLHNEIVIDVDNMSTDSPCNTSIIVDNEEINFNCNALPVYDHRAKIGGIGKKELDKDYGYEAQRKFLNSAFDLDMGRDSGVYYETAHNKGSPSVETVEAATRELYEVVCRKLNQGFRGVYDSPLSDFKHKLISTMLGCCYGVNEDSDTFCVIIPSGKVGYSAFNAKEIFETLYTSKLQAKCPSHMNPSIRIVDEENKELFQIRFKKERYGDNLTGHRYKMYFKPVRLKEYF